MSASPASASPRCHRARSSASSSMRSNPPMMPDHRSARAASAGLDRRSAFGQAAGAAMPRRADIERILVLGSGPIVIGQACEFDYSGTQAVKALRADGYHVTLLNSNPATIMTDPEIADRTYV